MADRLTSGMERLHARLRQFASQAVTYSDGEQSVGLAATAGTSELVVTDGGGVPVAIQSADWIVTAADLKFGNVPFEPAPGHRLTDAAGRVFEVMHIPGAMPWRFTDPSRIAVRIHTKQIQ